MAGALAVPELAGPLAVTELAGPLLVPEQVLFIISMDSLNCWGMASTPSHFLKTSSCPHMQMQAFLPSPHFSTHRPQVCVAAEHS